MFCKQMLWNFHTGANDYVQEWNTYQNVLDGGVLVVTERKKCIISMVLLGCHGVASQELQLHHYPWSMAMV